MHIIHFLFSPVDTEGGWAKAAIDNLYALAEQRSRHSIYREWTAYAAKVHPQRGDTWVHKESGEQVTIVKVMQNYDHYYGVSEHKAELCFIPQGNYSAKVKRLSFDVFSKLYYKKVLPFTVVELLELKAAGMGDKITLAQREVIARVKTKYREKVENEFMQGAIAAVRAFLKCCFYSANGRSVESQIGYYKNDSVVVKHRPDWVDVLIGAQLPKDEVKYLLDTVFSDLVVDITRYMESRGLLKPSLSDAKDKAKSGKPKLTLVQKKGRTK